MSDEMLPYSAILQRSVESLCPNTSPTLTVFVRIGISMLMQVLQTVLFSSAGVSVENLDKQLVVWGSSMSRNSRFLVVICGLVLLQIYHRSTYAEAGSSNLVNMTVLSPRLFGQGST